MEKRQAAQACLKIQVRTLILAFRYLVHVLKAFIIIILESYLILILLLLLLLLLLIFDITLCSSGWISITLYILNIYFTIIFIITVHMTQGLFCHPPTWPPGVMIKIQRRTSLAHAHPQTKGYRSYPEVSSLYVQYHRRSYTTLYGRTGSNTWSPLFFEKGGDNKEHLAQIKYNLLTSNE